MTHVVSHDLRAPLRAILGFSELLVEHLGDDLDDKSRLYLNYVVDGADQLQTMLDDLTEYARIDSRGNPPQPVDVGQACGDAIASLSEAIERSGASIEVGELPAAHADPAQVVTVFQCLIENAIKFNEAAPAVTITGEQRDGASVYRVRDNGIGIRSTRLSDVFAVFCRLHTREEYDGNGIGLALVQRAVSRNGGEVSVSSEFGAGSTFQVTLPSVPA